MEVSSVGRYSDTIRQSPDVGNEDGRWGGGLPFSQGHGFFKTTLIADLGWNLRCAVVNLIVSEEYCHEFLTRSSANLQAIFFRNLKKSLKCPNSFFPLERSN